MSLPELENECFYIAPIGAEDSDIRRRSDGILRFIVEPALGEFGLTAVRADAIAEPGQITLQVIQHVLGARAAVADLTGANANVFYELAIRHTARLPVVLIAERGEKLPFDIAQMRTIFFDHTDLNSAADCRDRIADHLRGALTGAVDSPIATAADLGSLEEGSRVERTLAEVVTTLEELSRQVTRGARSDLSSSAVADLIIVNRRLADLSQEIDDPRLHEALAWLGLPVGYLRRRIPVTASILSRREDRLLARSGADSEVDTGEDDVLSDDDVMSDPEED